MRRQQFKVKVVLRFVIMAVILRSNQITVNYCVDEFLLFLRMVHTIYFPTINIVYGTYDQSSNRLLGEF